VVHIIFLLVNIHHDLLGLHLPDPFIIDQMIIVNCPMGGVLNVASGITTTTTIPGLMTLQTKEKKASPQKNWFHSPLIILSVVAVWA